MTHSALQRYIAEQVQKSVVRIRDELVDPQGVATGFFIDPTGYLITAFHSVKHRFFGTSSALPITFEFDAANALDSHTVACSHTVNAYTTLDWANPEADWALLKLDFRPDCYLPLTEPGRGRVSRDLAGAELRVYGFNITDQNVAKISVFKGNYAGHVPDRKRHIVSYIVRTEGQSGGPVIDMSTGSVIGSVVGYRSREVLTGEAAELDQRILSSLGLDVNFRSLAHSWNVGAARSICINNDMLAPALESAVSPPLPEKMLTGRKVIKNIIAAFDENTGNSSIFLHGPGGAGKTTIAAEVAKELTRQRESTSIFYHDFEPQGNRGSTLVLQKLAVHLLMRHSRFRPIMACLDADSVVLKSEGFQTVVAAIREQTVVCVFDNVHCLTAGDHSDTETLLRAVESAASAGSSRVIFASRRLPPFPLQATVFPCAGFADDEVARFLELHDVLLEATELTNVCKFGSSIVCIEEVARSSDWRRQVARGVDVSDGTEFLQRYWTNNYAHLPESEHSLLLTAAVIGRPASRSELEEISGVSYFAQMLAALQRDPPLIKFRDGYFVHSDIEAAMLFVSDQQNISSVRSRAAEYFVRTGQYIEAARQCTLVSDTSRALEVLYDNRDDIITSGFVSELEQVVDSAADQLASDARKRRMCSHHINAISASYLTARGKYDEARSHWEHAIRTASDGSPRAALFRRLGDNNRMASDYESAAENYRAAAKLLENSNSHPDMNESAAASIGLGKLARLRADYEAAHQRYEKALDLYVHLYENTGIAEAGFGIGEVKRLQSDWGAAETAYASSCQHADFAENLERRAYALWGLGEICRLTGRMEEAIEQHRAGLDICVKIGDRRSEGWALLGIGQTEDAQGHPDIARAAYGEALAIFRQTKSNTEIAHTLLSLAESFRATGEVKEVLYEESGALYAKLNLRHCLVQHGAAKACALRTVGLRRQADSELKVAYKLAKKCNITAELQIISDLRKDQESDVVPALNFP